MVVVDAPRWLARARPGDVAHGVVEDEHAACAQAILQELFDLGIVGLLHFVFGVEVADLRRRLDECEAVGVERELVLAAAAVLDADLARIVDAVPLRHARRRVEHVAHGLLGAALQVVQGRGERLGLNGSIERHDKPPEVG